MYKNVIKSALAAVAFAGVVFIGVANTANAMCPTGSYPWTDSWGNKICKSFGSGATRSIEGGINNCPTGTHRWNDQWGNPICKSFSGNQQFYDTSDGCPIGTHPWTDSWGNPVCKSF